MPSRTNRTIGGCGFCKRPYTYPMIKVPLGPVQIVEEDTEAKASGLPIKEGFVRYSSACLPCAKKYLNSISEEYLEGKI